MSKKIEKLLQQAQAALQVGNREQAQRGYEKVLDKDPRHLDARYFLGTLLAEQGRYAEAQPQLEAASRLAPDSPYVFNNLGNLYLLTGRRAEAEQAFRRALRLAPQLVEALTNLGNLLVGRGALDEAISLAERAVALRPGEAAAQVMLANALKDQGRIGDALPHYRRAAELAPGSAAAQSNLLMALNYAPDVTPDALFDAHRQWGRRFAPATARPAVAADGRRLRIGYLSPDLGRHPVGYLIEPVLAAHDRARFEIFVYSDNATPDDVSARLRAQADTWRELAGADNDRAAAVIATDRLDVLVELAGHGAGNRLALLARRVAPVQASYLGYPATTGLASIDYVISDAWLDPAAADAAHYTETLWRLPRPCFAFRPDAEFPPVSPLPAEAPGAPTFGAFNALAKVNDEVVALWAAVLAAVPGSRLLMQARALSDEGSRARIAARFGAHGIAPERLELVGFTSLPEHLALFGRVDLCLDSFPWNGHMTTLDSLWMGVPVLTLAGERRAARMGAAMLGAVGLDTFVARSPAEFVAQAAALAADRGALREIRASLRGALEASALADGAGLARALEGAYTAMHDAALRSATRPARY